MSIPHINIKREGSTWNGWCVNYCGMFDRLKPLTHCKAGVEYKSVAKVGEHTYSYPGDTRKHTAKQAHPCFKHEHPLTNGCPHCRFPTPDEIKAHEDEMAGWIKRIAVAHAAIIAELDSRHRSGDATVQMNKSSQSEWDDEGPTDYVSGGGVMDCPVCKAGKLHYSRAAYNGHIHAKCSTKDCVVWMQ